jgi:hypothetical protein
MHLATDYIHPTPRGGRCRIRVYLPEDERDAPVVICSELPTNDGASITYAAEQLAAEVIRYHSLTPPLVWIEHHPPLSTDGNTETFDLVTFSSYGIRERGPYLGETRLTVGEAPGSASPGVWSRCSWAGRCKSDGRRPMPARPRRQPPRT